ncbi:hypothetical protein KBD81_00490 [Candidatus Woesebacteria bacterium]|nr:hypothetical protein [Candidatus Woesebacteria bacterium]
MSKIIMLLTITSLIFILAPQVQAQDVSVPPGLQYSCLKIDRCQTSGTCTSDHVHRVKLTKTRDFNATTGTESAYVTECMQVVEAGQNQSTMICTTGSATLDQELWGTTTGADQYLARLAADPILYSLSIDGSYGIFQQNTATGPTKVKIDDAGAMIPSAIEWQSYTKESTERRFLIWRTITASTDPTVGVDSGQKQGTLTWDTLSECNSEAWDPKGVVYDANSGMPVNDVDLTVQFSASASGPFELATAGIGQVLPPGTLPLKSRVAGLYSFFGMSGYYIIQPTSVSYDHAPKGTVIPSDVAQIYNQSQNYFSDSAPIFEAAGTVKVQNIPMIVKKGASVAPFTFKVLSANSKSLPGGKLQLDGRVNAPATLVVEMCTSPNGIPNCRNKKEYAPGQGGPSPSTDFKYSLTLNQKELENGEEYLLTIKQYTFSNQPKAFVPALLEKLAQTFSSLVPEVAAQESQAIQMRVEPIPTYIEGFAYDENGATIPTALVSIYVSFSPAPYYSVRANEMGYFQITSNHLPQDPYTIRFTNPTTSAVTQLTTSVFLAQNNEFMIVEKVDPFITVTEATNPRADVTPAFVPRPATGSETGTQRPVSQATPVPQQANAAETTQSATQTPSMLVLLGMILIGLVVVTVAVFLYFKKKKSMESGNMP